LRRHLNGHKNLEVVEAAVSDKSGIAHFSGERATGRLSTTGHEVKTVMLDDYRSPDFIKMDIEGAELSAIQGSRRILEERNASWFIALHGEAARDVPDSMTANGYSVHWGTHEEISVKPP
jgi:FkbM family methyltransferase